MKEQLQSLCDTINEFDDIATKRDRLNYLYNEEKASAIRSAVPNPLTILSTTKSVNWKQLVVNIAFTAVSSYANYKNAADSAEKSYLTSGWGLDDRQKENLEHSRSQSFNYMVDMVQEYNLDGLKTLNENDIIRFVETCQTESVTRKIALLEGEEETYELLGNYWLELADCYYETANYKKCLECVDKYRELSINIYRVDSNYAQILPKAIVAAQNIYSGEEYISVIKQYNEDLVKNTKVSENNNEWSLCYFAAQIYIDLYHKTNNASYLKEARDIIYKNINVLLDEQEDLNNTYINNLEGIEAEEPNYKFMTAEEKKEAKAEYREEQKRVSEYNNSLKEKRKTELPTLYEPLVLNCELLSAITDKYKMTTQNKNILQANLDEVLLVKPINNAYSFSNTSNKYSGAEMTKNEIIIPADLLTSGATITIAIKDGKNTTTYTDAVVTKVEREGDTIDTFKAHISSKGMKKYEWTENSIVSVKITYEDVYNKTLTLKFGVSEFIKRIYGVKVVFTQK